MSQTRYLKSMITPTLVESTENHEAGVASGVWSTQDQLEARRGGVWPEAGVTDPNTLIENNFSTTLYTGNNGTVDVNNNIDIDADGGLVWIKRRDDNGNNFLYDTVRSNQQALNSNRTNRDNDGQMLKQSGTGKGFTISGSDQTVNNAKYVSWTFKESPKFFDIVSYTGSGSAKTVAHSLGSVPGWILVKNLSAGEAWHVYHRGANGGTNPEQYNLTLNSTSAQGDNAGAWNDTAPTSTVFTIGTDDQVNTDGASYIAYLFAHETGSDSRIQCGNYEGSETAEDVAAVGRVIDLGWEPQWLLIKNTDASSNWIIMDSMRGVKAITTGNNVIELEPSTADGESSNPGIVFTATGFYTFSNQTLYNTNNSNYIYVAIRRPNMATITDATKVYQTDLQGSQNQSVYPSFLTGYATAGGQLNQAEFPVDWAWYKSLGGAESHWTHQRNTMGNALQFNANNDEDNSNTNRFEYQNGWVVGSAGNVSTDYRSWMFRRAKSFLDIVQYNGTSANRTVAHGLGAVPEMMWIKNRSSNEDWTIYHANMSGTPQNTYQYLNLNSAAGTSNTIKYWNHTAPTSSVFTVGIEDRVNDTGKMYTAYLFATLAGVSKCFGVAHSGSSTDVDCGFTSGARFVMLKRTDATDPWYYWDSARGIIAGNDPYLIFNTNAAQEAGTDFIDPLASGFQISGAFQDGDYIGWAIA